MTEQDNLGKEIEAMKTVADALQGLPNDARGRVVTWAIQVLGIASAVPTASAPPVIARGPVSNSVPVATSTPSQPDGDTGPSFGHEELATFFAAASAKDGVHEALAVSYWLQFVNDRSDFGGGDVNKELKNLGHKASNITSTLTKLMRKKPQLVVQVKKTGTSRQARKRYKVTTAGKAVVEQMFAGGPDDS